MFWGLLANWSCENGMDLLAMSDLGLLLRCVYMGGNIRNQVDL